MSAGTDRGAGTDAPAAITVEGLTKRFRLFANPWHRVGEWLRPKAAPRHQQVVALRNISFTVERGACLGIIGINGSGKSTLLKLLTGVLQPTEGRLETRGRVLALLELGTGFNPELTGRQNIVISSSLLGFPEGYAAARMNDIEAFADIGAFFDRPMRIYSSGMIVRLAFSTFLFLDPDILIVDEALAVGDIFFQQKCHAAMQAIRQSGTTMLFVSHDMVAIQNLCSRVILLRNGELAYDGAPDEAISRYFAEVGRVGRGSAAAAIPHARCDQVAASRVVTLTENSLLNGRVRYGEHGLCIAAARVTDDQGRDTLRVRSMEFLTFEVLLQAKEAIPEPNCGIELFDRFNRLVFAISAFHLHRSLPPVAAGWSGIVTIRLRLSLEPGEYTFSLTASDLYGRATDNLSFLHDRHDSLGPLNVYWDRELLPFYGVAALDCRIELEDERVPHGTM